jgi:hypothetical protein
MPRRRAIFSIRGCTDTLPEDVPVRRKRLLAHQQAGFLLTRNLVARAARSKSFNFAQSLTHASKTIMMIFV